MALSDIELRVLGALIEKDRTTPEGYPLSSQALTTACNQRTSRDPVTDYHLQDVMAAVARLRDRGLAETIQEVGDRVPKHKHEARRALDLDTKEEAVLAVLLLRGPQTPGELRSRTERYVSFPDVATVEATLERLGSRSAPLVRNLGRGAGQSQYRWTHTLGGGEERLMPRVRQPRADGRSAEDGSEAARVAVPPQGEPEASTAQAGHGGAADRAGALDHAALLRRIEDLERRVAALETQD